MNSQMASVKSLKISSNSNALRNSKDSSHPDKKEQTLQCNDYEVFLASLKIY